VFGIQSNRKLILGVAFLLVLFAIKIFDTMATPPSTIVKVAVENMLLGNNSNVEIKTEDEIKIANFKNRLDIYGIDSFDVLVTRNAANAYIIRIESIKYHPNGDIADIFYGYLSIILTINKGEWVITNVKILKPFSKDIKAHK